MPISTGDSGGLVLSHRWWWWFCCAIDVRKQRGFQVQVHPHRSFVGAVVVDVDRRAVGVRNPDPNIQERQRTGLCTVAISSNAIYDLINARRCISGGLFRRLFRAFRWDFRGHACAWAR